MSIVQLITQPGQRQEIYVNQELKTCHSWLDQESRGIRAIFWIPGHPGLGSSRT